LLGSIFRIRIRIGSAFDGLLEPDPDPEGVKSAQKKINMKISTGGHFLCSTWYRIILGKELCQKMFDVRIIR
jgi:hypothetical protein